MIELFLILFRFPVKNNSIYEILNVTELHGKCADINYIKNHTIQQKYFVYNSSGDTDNYPISNVFDDTSNTIWVSKHSNTNFYHPYIIINFLEHFNIESIIYDTVYRTVKNEYGSFNRIFDGFPLVLKVFSSLNNEDFQLKYVFHVNPTFSMDKIQFNFTHPILCDKLKLEFTNVTFDGQISFQNSACSRGISFIKSDNDQNHSKMQNLENFGISENKKRMEELEYCEPKPSNSYDMIDEIPSRSNVTYYSCYQIISQKFAGDICVYYVYYSNFSSILDPSHDGGAIYIFSRSNGIKGDSKFFKCTFSKCAAMNGGAIFIITAQYSRFYNISNCTFIDNEAEDNGGAICFFAAAGTIFGCEFINNIGKKGGSIFYMDNSLYFHDGRIFNIDNNRFLRTNIKSNECSIFYFYIIRYSNLKFTNNTIISSTEFYNNKTVIESDEYSRTDGNYFFSSNVVLPCCTNIYSDGNLSEIVKNGFGSCEIIKQFNSIGSYSFQLKAGQYIVRCYGAQGGNAFLNGEYLTNTGGKGAYARGTMIVKGANTTFYAFVGGMGMSSPSGPNEGGFNGGGNSGKDNNIFGDSGDDASGGGGGATDLRIYNGSNINRIIVAAGGSGGSGVCKGAYGGVYKVVCAIDNNVYAESENEKDINGNKGIGGQGNNSLYIPGSGGGGGYMGGRGGDQSLFEHSSYKAVGCSGSSYISGDENCEPNPSMQFSNTEIFPDYNTGNGLLIIEKILECSQNCISCTNETFCTMCESGYFLSNFTTSSFFGVFKFCQEINHATESPTQSPLETPTASQSIHATSSPTQSPSETPTASQSIHATSSPTQSPSETPTASQSIHATSSPTQSPSETSTASQSVHATESPTQSPLETSTASQSIHATSSLTQSPSETPTASHSVHETEPPTETPIYVTEWITKQSTNEPDESSLELQTQYFSELLIDSSNGSIENSPLESKISSELQEFSCSESSDNLSSDIQNSSDFQEDFSSESNEDTSSELKEDYTFESQKYISSDMQNSFEFQSYSKSQENSYFSESQTFSVKSLDLSNKQESASPYFSKSTPYEYHCSFFSTDIKTKEFSTAKNIINISTIEDTPNKKSNVKLIAIILAVIFVVLIISIVLIVVLIIKKRNQLQESKDEFNEETKKIESLKEDEPSKITLNDSSDNDLNFWL